MKEITAYMIADKIGKIKEDEYANEKGLPICKLCNTPRYFISEDGEYIARSRCKCQIQALDKEMEKEATENKKQEIKNLKSYAITNKRYENVTFENTELIKNESFIQCYNRCRSYCKNADKVINTGLGLYICGNVGCGKTHLIYCMVNELTNSLYSCIVTNFINICNTIKFYFNNRVALQDYLEKLYSVDFLFIDDIGAEKVTDNDGNGNWVQERMFEIIDERYNNNKPVIFTSNNLISDLIKQGIHERLASRIHEMSSVVFNINAESYRLKIKKEQKLPF